MEHSRCVVSEINKAVHYVCMVRAEDCTLYEDYAKERPSYFYFDHLFERSSRPELDFEFWR